ncbi:ArdC family protein [Chloroflexota bacterium]
MKNNGKNTCNELMTKITSHIEQLAIETDKARMSEEMLRYLDAYSRFHQYSFNNVVLILMAKPDATRVAGFKAWQKMGRYVRKGEHGIPILAPIIVNKQEDNSFITPRDIQNTSNPEEFLIGFKIVYVFDISQTDGDPLPETPEWKSPEKKEILSQKLIQFAESRGIQVSEHELQGETQGVSKGGTILISPEAGTLTLIHEIAHEMMHRDKSRPISRSIVELEAEAVSYVVGKYCGMDGLACPNYIALHGNDSKEVLESLDRIRKVAAEIIKTIFISMEELD